MFGKARPAPAAPQGAPIPPPAASAPPPPPPPPAAAEPSIYVAQNGQAVLMPAAQARTLPGNTPAMRQGDGAWSTIAAVLPPAASAPTPPPPPPAPAAAAAPARGAFGRAAPAAAAPAAAPAVGPARNLFAGVENAEVVRRGSYIEPGDYVARLLEAVYKPGRTGNMVIFELEVLQSSYEQARPETHGCNKIGDKISVFVKQNDSFASNIKEAIIALSGFNEQGEARPVEDTVTQDECNALISAEQPYRGAVVYLEAREKDTRAGGKFTRTSWWPCPTHADGSPDLERLQRDVR